MISCVEFGSPARACQPKQRLGFCSDLFGVRRAVARGRARELVRVSQNSGLVFFSVLFGVRRAVARGRARKSACQTRSCSSTHFPLFCFRCRAGTRGCLCVGRGPLCYPANLFLRFSSSTSTRRSSSLSCARPSLGRSSFAVCTKLILCNVRDVGGGASCQHTAGRVRVVFVFVSAVTCPKSPPTGLGESRRPLQRRTPCLMSIGALGAEFH